MSCAESICHDCGLRMNHKITRVCDKCGSHNVEIDLEPGAYYDQDTADYDENDSEAETLVQELQNEI